MATTRALALGLMIVLAASASTVSASSDAPAKYLKWFDCSGLPANWGGSSDDDNNNNGPWGDLTSNPTEAITSQIYSIFQSRYGRDALTKNLAGCSNWTDETYGCQQTAGQGMNYALQINFTCASPSGDNMTLGITTDVNTYQQYVNVDDLDVQFLSVNGKMVTGNLTQEQWYDANDSIWYNNEDDNNNDNNDENDSDNSDSEYYGKNIGAGFAEAGMAKGAEEEAAGKAIGASFEQMFGRKLK